MSQMLSGPVLFLLEAEHMSITDFLLPWSAQGALIIVPDFPPGPSHLPEGGRMAC